jgi:hypothetical protein
MAARQKTKGSFAETPVKVKVLKPTFVTFRVWLIGDTPLITHAWSHKAKQGMLQKQLNQPGEGKEPRNPEADFAASRYEMGKDMYGFPVTGIKNCIMNVAHKDKGIAKTDVMSSLWLDGEMTRVGPARAGAICDMPLVRIYGSKPEMREDMVRVGVGLNKTASLAYRAQFTRWAIRLSGRLRPKVLPLDSLAFLISEAGISCGLGEWRNEKRGIFGAFHLGDSVEDAQWERYAAGEGPLPLPRHEVALAAE